MDAEWLGRRLDEQGMKYRRYDNSFPRLEDFPQAQQIMDQMQQIAWPSTLDAVARQLNPAHGTMFREIDADYYWTAFQTEWATDIAFADAKDLAAIYPQLTRGAISSLGCQDVLRFLGKRSHWNYQGEIQSSYKDRCEGIRIKHWAYGNSVKAYEFSAYSVSGRPSTPYDKGGSLLRLETTVNNPSAYRCYRTLENDPQGELAWRPLRKGVADLHRRGEISQQCNDRYADALASLDTSTPLGELTSSIGQAVRKAGKRYRALRPGTPEDRQLLEAVNDGAWTLNGFSNRDLVGRLYKTSQDPVERRRIASRVSYRIRLLRAHGLIRKIPKRRRYQITTKGREIVTALCQTQHITLEQLNALAA